jgi:hypothetical protein
LKIFKAPKISVLFENLFPPPASEHSASFLE